jgi:hypothetical protein
MSLLRTVAAIRTIQRICNTCARVQLVRAQPSQPAVCKYCGNIMPGHEPALDACADAHHN